MINDAEKRLRKENRLLRASMLDLCKTVETACNELDDAMKGPSTYARGQEVGKIATYLEYAKDCAMHFGLGLKLGTKASNKRLTAKD